jgi:hypothetical protein
MRIHFSWNRPAGPFSPAGPLFALLALLAIVFGGAASAQAQDTITIKDPKEFNAYQNCEKTTDPRTKSACFEAFLQQYPATVVKSTVLDTQIDTYQGLNDVDLTLSAANRLLQLDPTNLKAVFISVFIKNRQCARSVDQKTGKSRDPQTCDDAATLAHKGLALPKPASTLDEDWKKLTTGTYPIFHSAIALDDIVSREDFGAGIAEYRTELTLYPVEQTKSGSGLWDTLQLAETYIKQEAVDAKAGRITKEAAKTDTNPNMKSKVGAARDADGNDLAQAVWFYARAWNFAPAGLKTPIEVKMKYYYSKYHDGLDGLDEIKSLAEANLFPPEMFCISPSAPSGSSPIEPHKRPIARPEPPRNVALVDPDPISLSMTTPITSGGPQWPADKKAGDASVTWDSQGLYITATNSSLRQILDDVATATGASVEGLDTDQRIFGVYGPGKARDVLTDLLQGTSYNILLIGDQGAGTPREIVLSSRHGGAGTAAPANPAPAEEETEAEEPPQPPPPPPMRPGFGPGGQRTPQQMRPQPGLPQPQQPTNPQ